MNENEKNTKDTLQPEGETRSNESQKEFKTSQVQEQSYQEKSQEGNVKGGKSLVTSEIIQEQLKATRAEMKALKEEIAQEKALKKQAEIRNEFLAKGGKDSYFEMFKKLTSGEKNIDEKCISDLKLALPSMFKEESVISANNTLLKFDGASVTSEDMTAEEPKPDYQKGVALHLRGKKTVTN